MIRYASVVAVLLLVIAMLVGAADAPSHQPTLIAERWRTPPGAKPASNGLRIYLINTTQRPIKVVTLDLDTGLDSDGQSQALTLGLSAEVRFRDHLLVPSLTDFSPVDLHPGEAAVIAYELRPAPGLPGHNATEPEPEIMEVRYEVKPSWGERFGIWSGSISTKVTVHDVAAQKRQ